VIDALLAQDADHRGTEIRKDERPCTWQVVRVVGFDETGRKVAER
jgi:hypothetical protein